MRLSTTRLAAVALLAMMAAASSASAAPESYEYRVIHPTYGEIGTYTNIVDIDFKDVKIGMNVKLKFIQTEGDGPPMPFFTPA